MLAFFADCRGESVIFQDLHCLTVGEIWGLNVCSLSIVRNSLHCTFLVRCDFFARREGGLNVPPIAEKYRRAIVGRPHYR